MKSKEKILIDLHMHTVHSDGTNSVVEMLKKAKELNLEVISFTDHDNVDSYNDLEQIKIEEYYRGKIIVGVEFTTLFLGHTIEILGYGCDYKIIDKALKNFYTPKFKAKDHKYQMLLLAKNIKTMGLTFDFSNKDNCKDFHSFYEELIRHPENYNLVKDDLLANFRNFLRKGYANPCSELYINKENSYLKIDKIVDLIHSSGGKAFLAHPFVYQFKDTKNMLDKIFDSAKIEGIECFYSSFSNEQTNFLLKYAAENNLLISGGSDYHGALRPQVSMGKGVGNLNIKKSIINNWDIYFFN